MGQESLEQHLKTLADWRAELAELERQLARAIPEVRLEQLRAQASREALAAALPAGATLVEYVKYRRYDFAAVHARGETAWREWRYLALLLQHGRPDAIRYVDLGDAAPIDASIYLLHRTLLGDP